MTDAQREAIATVRNSVEKAERDGQSYVADLFSVSTLRDLLDAVAALTARAEVLQHHLSNILATVHRDGGHHEAEVGTGKAVEDALQLIPATRARAEEAEREHGALVEEYDSFQQHYQDSMAEAQKVHDKWLTDAFAERDAALARAEEAERKAQKWADESVPVDAVIEAAAGFLDLYAITPDEVLKRWIRLKHALAALNGGSNGR